MLHPCPIVKQLLGPSRWLDRVCFQTWNNASCGDGDVCLCCWLGFSWLSPVIRKDGWRTLIGSADVVPRAMPVRLCWMQREGFLNGLFQLRRSWEHVGRRIHLKDPGHEAGRLRRREEERITVEFGSRAAMSQGNLVRINYSIVKPLWLGPYPCFWRDLGCGYL